MIKFICDFATCIIIGMFLISPVIAMLEHHRKMERFRD